MAKKYTAWQKFIQDESGQIIVGADIEVRKESTGGLATIYSDESGSVQLTNPFQSDSNGQARFYVSEGKYKITASSGTFIATERNVSIGSKQSQDIQAAIDSIAFDSPITESMLDQTIIIDSPTDIDLTFDGGLEIGFVASFCQIGAGRFSFIAPTGESIVSLGSIVQSTGVGATITAIKINAITWLLRDVASAGSIDFGKNVFVDSLGTVPALFNYTLDFNGNDANSVHLTLGAGSAFIQDYNLTLIDTGSMAISDQYQKFSGIRDLSTGVISENQRFIFKNATGVGSTNSVYADNGSSSALCVASVDTYNTPQIDISADHSAGTAAIKLRVEPVSGRVRAMVNADTFELGEDSNKCIPIFPNYTVATLPAAAFPNEWGVIIVTDEIGGQTLAVSDNTNWLRVSDGAIVS